MKNTKGTWTTIAKWIAILIIIIACFAIGDSILTGGKYVAGPLQNALSGGGDTGGGGGGGWGAGTGDTGGMDAFSMMIGVLVLIMVIAGCGFAGWKGFVKGHSWWKGRGEPKEEPAEVEPLPEGEVTVSAEPETLEVPDDRFTPSGPAPVEVITYTIKNDTHDTVKHCKLVFPKELPEGVSIEEPTFSEDKVTIQATGREEDKLIHNVGNIRSGETKEVQVRFKIEKKGSHDIGDVFVDYE